MYVLRPQYTIDLSQTTVPFFYLMGPVQGGGDWPHKMYRALVRIVGSCIVATPSKWTESHPLASYFTGTLGTFERQTDWECEYRKFARIRPRSCIVAWLPKESTTEPRRDNNPYARYTYGDLGTLCGLIEAGVHVPLVLGGNLAFPGLSNIRRNFDRVNGRPFPFYQTIKRVSEVAGALVRT